jgi:hypothetical protein
MKLIKIISGAALLLTTSCATKPTSFGIPNFYKVSPGVWRGGQPSREGWDYLKAFGVSRVIKLNTEREGSDNYAEQIGMTVYRAPINFWQQIGLESLQPGFVFNRYGGISMTNIFIHCQHGEDRTGLVVGMYRIQCNGWSKEKAQEEMMQHNFHPILHGLWEFWEDKVK